MGEYYYRSSMVIFKAGDNTLKAPFTGVEVIGAVGFSPRRTKFFPAEPDPMGRRIT